MKIKQLANVSHDETPLKINYSKINYNIPETEIRHYTNEFSIKRKQLRIFE